MTTQKLNNKKAREGCDRCYCGCKYWENDKCIDCDTAIDDCLRDPDWLLENRTTAIREALQAGKRAWFSGRVSDNGVSLGEMTPDEWNGYATAALAELEALEAVAEAARAASFALWESDESEMAAGEKLRAALARLAAVPDGPLDTSYRERRVERRMADPEYRQAYQQATQDGQTDG